jgi:hypothetical protein
MSEILETLAEMEREFKRTVFGREDTLDRITSTIHEYTMRVAREVSVWRGGYAPPKLHHLEERLARDVFPLPPKRVLREEPVPGSIKILYRVQDGVLQQSYPHLPGHWEVATVSPRDFALMRHALDLHDNPYREEPQ